MPTTWRWTPRGTFTWWAATKGTLEGNTKVGGWDAFLVKYDSGGTLLWAKQFGTTNGDMAYGVAVGPQGDVYVGGWNGSDAVLVKFDPNGTQRWSNQFHSISTDRFESVAVDADDNAYATGYSNSGGNDSFVVKYGPDGARLWDRHFTASGGWVYAKSVAVDSGGSAYVTGLDRG